MELRLGKWVLERASLLGTDLLAVLDSNSSDA
jgi:hypothetical protein